jgi:sec-independent protein translocase protein TatB
MFNIGPMEVVVLAIVGLIVLGPDRLPGLTRDAARLLRNLRDLATGARQQLRDELGPEFADVDLRNLNPRTAVQRVVFGDDLDLSKLNPRTAMRDAIFGDEDLRAADPRTVVRETRDEIKGAATPLNLTKPANGTKPGSVDKPAGVDKPVSGSMPVSTSKAEGGAASPGASTPARTARTDRPRPSPRPRQVAPPSTPYDADAT